MNKTKYRRKDRSLSSDSSADYKNRKKYPMNDNSNSRELSDKRIKDPKKDHNESRGDRESSPNHRRENRDGHYREKDRHSDRSQVKNGLKDPRESRDPRDKRDPRDSRFSDRRDHKETKDQRETKDPRDNKDLRDRSDPRNNRDSKPNTRDPRDPRDRDPRDRDPRDPRKVTQEDQASKDVTFAEKNSAVDRRRSRKNRKSSSSESRSSSSSAERKKYRRKNRGRSYSSSSASSSRQDSAGRESNTPGKKAESAVEMPYSVHLNEKVSNNYSSMQNFDQSLLSYGLNPVQSEFTKKIDQMIEETKSSLMIESFSSASTSEQSFENILVNWVMMKPKTYQEDDKKDIKIQPQTRMNLKTIINTPNCSREDLESLLRDSSTLELYESKFDLTEH